MYASFAHQQATIPTNTYVLTLGEEMEKSSQVK